MKDAADPSPRLPLVNASKSQPLAPARPHAFFSGKPYPSLTREEFLRLEAAAFFFEMKPAQRIPGESDCWKLWGPGVPCLHPDGLGHLGPHGRR
jgi:hypothetical protein